MDSLCATALARCPSTPFRTFDRRRFASQAQARMAVFTFIKGFYNPLRRHSALGYRSPIRYEKEMLADPSPAS